MNPDRLYAAFQQIKKIAQQALNERSVKARRRTEPHASLVVAPSSANALPNHILRLRDSGFFKAPKTAIEIHAKLQPTYSCDVNRVAMALLRLQRRKKLRKTSKVVGKRKQVAYGW